MQSTLVTAVFYNFTSYNMYFSFSRLVLLYCSLLWRGTCVYLPVIT